MYGWGLEYCANYWLIRSPRFIQFVPLYIMLSSFYIDHISGAWPLGNLLNLGLFDRRPCRLLSTPPLGQGQKRPAGEHFQLCHELEIIIWRLMEVDNTLLICRSSCCLSWSPPSSSTSWEGSSPGGTTGLMHCIQANFDDWSILRPTLLMGLKVES